MGELTEEQTIVIRDLAQAGGSLVVSTEVVRGPVIGLWLAGLIRSNAVEIGRVEFHLTEKGWRVAEDLSPPDSQRTL